MEKNIRYIKVSKAITNCRWHNYIIEQQLKNIKGKTKTIIWFIKITYNFYIYVDNIYITYINFHRKNIYRIEMSHYNNKRTLKSTSFRNI